MLEHDVDPQPRDERVQLSHTGYGEQFDSAALKALPAGSFSTEPANLPHFVETRGDVLIQVLSPVQ